MIINKLKLIGKVKVLTLALGCTLLKPNQMFKIIEGSDEMKLVHTKLHVNLI